MKRVFTELSEREDIVAQLIAKGFEAKEVAQLLFKSVATVRNQMQSIYLKLDIRNRSELSIKLMERIFNVKLTMDLSPIVRSMIACCLLCIFSITFYQDFHSDMRMARRNKVEYKVRSDGSRFMAT